MKVSDFNSAVSKWKKLFLLILIVTLTACGSTTPESEEPANEVIPELIEITLFDENGSQIMQEDGWYAVSNHTKIKVRFDGHAEWIFFYITPTGTETYGLREKIGYVCAYDLFGGEIPGFGYDSGVAEFIWDTSNNDVFGHLGVELINGTVAKVEPNVLNVMPNTQTTPSSTISVPQKFYMVRTRKSRRHCLL